MKVLRERVPNFSELTIHESSPSDPVKTILLRECNNYSYSYYYDGVEAGNILEQGGTNQNLENLTFDDKTFVVFITQDVMEHVIRPKQAFKEINRVLKPGGLHIFTTPVWELKKTTARISVDRKGNVNNVLPEVYHGNPIDKSGSLVTYDWGYDICDYIERCSKMKTEIIKFWQNEENFEAGLEGDFLLVMVSTAYKRKREI